MKLIKIIKTTERLPMFHLEHGINEIQEVPEEMWQVYLRKRTSHIEAARQIDRFFTEFKDEPIHSKKNDISEDE